MRLNAQQGLSDGLWKHADNLKPKIRLKYNTKNAQLSKGGKNEKNEK